MDRISRECQRAMDNAMEYESWRDAAAELDRREGFEEWRQQEVSDDYDWRLVRSRLRQLRQFRAENDVSKLIYHLRQGLHWNLGHIGNPALYAHARVGTKLLIHDYVDEVVRTLDYLCDVEVEGFGLAEKLQFFHETALSYGRSALMLSGGATLGLFHVGVLKALYRQDVLPTVLSGSSAGSVVAATVGTRSPQEMEALLDAESSYYHFWKPLKMREMLQRRAVMDQNQVRRAIARNVRDMTFEEGFKLSGKAINITVSPAGSNQPPRLLNYLTFPYLFIREAVLASCAVPLLFPPVMLMTRDENGERVPYMPLLRWNDGSLKSDLPTLRLRRLHNVNHFIVSQTNPHVLPFMTAKAPGQSGLLHATREFVYSTLRAQSTHVLNLARQNLPRGRVKNHLDTASSILDQDYRGNVTIFPKISLWRYVNVTTNPTLETVKRFILEGERAAWPRLESIRVQTAISQTLDRCVERLEKRSEFTERRPVPGRPGLRVVRARK